MNIRTKNMRCSGFRKRIWDVYNGYHCSIVGTCLRREELRKIAKKKVYALNLEITDFELHTNMVSLASENSARAKALHTYLDTKYQSAVIRYSKVKTDNAIETLWRIDAERGAIAGAFWAVMTSMAPSQDLVHRIYGEIHMLGHDFLGDHQNNLRRLNELRDNKNLLQEVLVSERQYYQQQKKELEERLAGLARMERDYSTLDKEVRTLRADNESMRNLLQQDSSMEELNKLKVQIAFQRQNTAALCGSVDSLTVELRQSLATIAELKDANDRLARENVDYQQEMRAMEAALMARSTVNSTVTSTVNNCGNCAEQLAGRCPGPDLCGKKVLYVGGLHKMVPHYQQMVEHYGGRFMHHDGGVEAARNQLPKMLGSADVVFCPVDCVSHDACTCVKKMCKHYQKPFIMMRSSGLSTLAKELDNIVH